MPVALLTVRALTEDEVREVERLARSRTAPARLVQRAQIVALARGGQCVTAVGARLGVHHRTVRLPGLGVRRFTAQGLDGLADRPRAGRPPTYTTEEVGTVVAAALTKPQDVGLPFACWTLDRLAAHLTAERGIAMKRSRIDEILRAEGVRWRKHETWFGVSASGWTRGSPKQGGHRRALHGAT